MAMEVSGEPRAVASAAYNFVRWFAGVVAPYAAPSIAARFGESATFAVAACAALVGVGVIWSRRHHLGRFGSIPLAAE